MSLSRMFDASLPPAAQYPGCQAVAGYIGGATPHVWTLQEWQRFQHLRQLPIWVKEQGTTALAQADAAAKAVVRFGWRAHAHYRRAIVLDMETWVDNAFVTAFTGGVHEAGFSCWVYGSSSSVYSNPHADGYWVADWDNVATLQGFRDARAVQYINDKPWENTKVDLSMISDSALLHLGYGARRLV